MSKRAFFLLWLITLLVTSCTSANTTPQKILNTPAYTPPPLTDDWTISMTKSGGIMGMLRSIEVQADGSYTVTDERAKNTVTGALKSADVKTLSGLIVNTEVAVQKSKMVCADCFVYDISIQSNGQKMVVNLVDMSLPDSGMEELVAFLNGVMDSALK